MSCLVDPLMRLCNKRDRVYLESRSRKEKAEMCFNHLDFNKDSYITFDEFMATEIELTEDNVHEVQAQFKKIDFDNNRRLTKDEYIEAFLDMTQMHSEDAFNLFVEAVLRSSPHSEKTLNKAGISTAPIESSDDESSEDEEAIAKAKKKKKKEKKKKEKKRHKMDIEAIMNGKGMDLAQRQTEKKKKKKHKKKKHH